mgnify:CR=1 FL=1
MIKVSHGNSVAYYSSLKQKFPAQIIGRVQFLAKNFKYTCTHLKY